MTTIRAWSAALTKGAWARGIELRQEVAYAELVEEPPRPGPRPARQVVAQPNELEQGCRRCGKFHGLGDVFGVRFEKEPATIDAQP